LLPTILWTVALGLTIIFLFLLALVGLRKFQFDAIHHNFLDLEDKYGGRVIRAGFAVRPSYAGKFKGQEVNVAISTEKTEGERRYYIGVTMETKAKINFFIKSTAWMGKTEIPEDQKERTLCILNKQYWLEAKDARDLRTLDLPDFEKIVSAIHPFAYILVGNSRMLLERISYQIVNDTQLEIMRTLFEGMYRLKKTLE
jgi:hypothetical protein